MTCSETATAPSAAPSFPYLQDGTLTLKQRDDGRYELSTPGAFGLPVACTYWQVANVREGDDRWRYQLTNHSELSHSGPFAHPTEHGCQIAIWSHFVQIGLIRYPSDNSHLDETDRRILNATEMAWANRTTILPRTGDFLRLADGTLKRFCKVTDRYAQSTTALEESYYIGATGHVSYSGGLDAGIDHDQLTFTSEIRRGQFWFFHHARSGPGRALRVSIPCEVWACKA